MRYQGEHVARFGMWVLAIVLAAPGHARDRPEMRCKTSKSSPSVKLCASHLTPMEARETQSWIFRVEGTVEKVQFRIHNLTPAVDRVKKGPIFTTSGGRNNKKKVKVKKVVSAAGALDFAFYDDDPAIESKTIAAMLVPSLTKLATAFERDAGRWLAAAARGDAKLRDARKLLAGTEKGLQELLNGYQELGALRDCVTDRFDRAERILAGRRARFAPPSPIVLIASRPVGPRPRPTYRLARSEGGDAELATSAFDSISNLFERLLEIAGGNDLVTDLLVTSKPSDGAQFLMRPWSRRESASDTRETQTGKCLRSVYRGLYSYEVKKSDERIECDQDVEDCAPLDLVDDSLSTFECNLAPGLRFCHRRPTPEGLSLKDLCQEDDNEGSR